MSALNLPRLAEGRRGANPSALFRFVVSFFILNWFFQGVASQYNQHWGWQTVNGEQVPTWTPQPGTIPPRPIFIPTGETLFLEYNCYYMPSICQNARTYLISATGSARRWRTAFAYDFNVGRGHDRRGTVCNGTWSNNHACPERAGPGNIAQHLPRYSGGVWPEVDVLPAAPNLQLYTIQGYTDANGQHHDSNLAYTCDEWPAAPWVEGGSGLPRYGGTQAYTRCAPQKTCAGLKSEQDWQGSSHNKLRGRLKSRIRRKHSSTFVPNDDAGLFFFRMVNTANGVAARMVHVDDNGAETENTQPATRNSISSLVDYMDWADSVDLSRLSSRYVANEEIISIHGE